MTETKTSSLAITINNRLHLSELGMSLILMAFPMAMYFRTFVSDIRIGNYFMILGVLLLFPYKNFSRTFQTTIWSKNMVFLILFQLVALLYYYISDFNYSTYALYHYLVIVCGVALTYTRFEKDLYMHNVIVYVGIESFVCAILSYFVLDTGLVVDLIEELDKDERIMDYLTIASVGVTNVACCTYFMGRSNHNVEKILLYLCVFFDFLVINMTQKRTPFIVALIIVAIYIYKQMSSSPKRNILMLLSFVALAYLFTSIYKDILTDNFANIINGIDDLINGTYQLDDTNSASQRYYNREKALNIISHFTTENFLFGKGYMTLWFDNPLLQSYLDMGIYGALCCFYFFVLLPLRTLFSKKIYDNYIFWAFAVASYCMVGCMSTGHPYSHNKWIPIIILVYVLAGTKSKNRTLKNAIRN